MKNTTIYIYLFEYIYFVIPYISVWGFSFVGCYVARIRLSFLPSVLLAPSSTYSLIHLLTYIARAYHPETAYLHS